MLYNRLGRTDMVVSKVSLGGANFGDIYGKFDQAKVEKIVAKAFDFGINFIDTAYWYGQGKSEERLGKVLKNTPRETYYISSKIGRYERQQEKMFDFSAEKTTKAFDDCLRRLQMPYIDLIQIHDAEFAESENILFDETLPVLEKIKNSGRARYIGVSGYDVEFMSSLVERSPIKIDSVLVFGRATLHDTALEDYMPIFEEHGVGVINASSLSMGMLTPQGPPSWHPAPDWMKDKCAEGAKYCQQNNYDIVKLARNFSTNFPGVSSTILGVEEPSELNKASIGLEELSGDEVKFTQDLRKKFFCDWSVNNYFEEMKIAFGGRKRLLRNDQKILDGLRY